MLVLRLASSGLLVLGIATFIFELSEGLIAKGKLAFTSVGWCWHRLAPASLTHLQDQLAGSGWALGIQTLLEMPVALLMVLVGGSVFWVARRFRTRSRSPNNDLPQP